MEGWDEAYLHNFLECPGAQGQAFLIGDLSGGAVTVDSHKALLQSDKGSSPRNSLGICYSSEVICMSFMCAICPIISHLSHSHLIHSPPSCFVNCFTSILQSKRVQSRVTIAFSCHISLVFFSLEEFFRNSFRILTSLKMIGQLFWQNVIKMFLSNHSFICKGEKKNPCPSSLLRSWLGPL